MSFNAIQENKILTKISGFTALAVKSKIAKYETSKYHYEFRNTISKKITQTLSMLVSLKKKLNGRVFIPRHTLVSGYYVIPFGVCPSVRPCSPFPIDNLSIYSWNFFKFCIHIFIGDEWYGIVNGQNPSIFNGVTALFRIGKMVSGLLFLYCS